MNSKRNGKRSNPPPIFAISLFFPSRPWFRSPITYFMRDSKCISIKTHSGMSVCWGNNNKTSLGKINQKTSSVNKTDRQTDSASVKPKSQLKVATARAREMGGGQREKGKVAWVSQTIVPLLCSSQQQPDDRTISKEILETVHKKYSTQRSPVQIYRLYTLLFLLSVPLLTGTFGTGTSRKLISGLFTNLPHLVSIFNTVVVSVVPWLSGMNK